MVKLIYTDLYLRFNTSIVFITNYFSVVTNIRYLDSGRYGYLLLQADENGTREGIPSQRPTHFIRRGRNGDPIEQKDKEESTRK
jgi:hypothetical protein